MLPVRARRRVGANSFLSPLNHLAGTRVAVKVPTTERN
jgi:hypothetical protein